MKEQKMSIFRQICTWAGITLLVAAVTTMVIWQWSVETSLEKNQEILYTLRTILPEPEGALLESRSNNEMAALSLAGTDFVGILEMPRYGSALPVSMNWGAVSKYPCRFGGSIYDGTMEIGATSQKGQFDFYREISVGDQVCFTDMEGNRFTYAITDIRYEKHADETALGRKEADLTLFVKNMYSFEYIVIFCSAWN